MVGYQQIQAMTKGTRGTAADFANWTALTKDHIRPVLQWMEKQTPPTVRLVSSTPYVWEVQ
ncbi:hypothetical protein [Xanthobacter autotrophicus]|uniref:hypothetical protein n=1 Tax=Xanthobacter autotrophicus TaxID=280 RepID=UPI00372633F5